MKKLVKITHHLLFILLIVNYSYSQTSRLRELGSFLYTYKHNKFYWGLSFELNDNIKSIEQKKYRLISKSGKLIRGRSIKSDNDSNIFLKFDEYGNVVEEKYYNYPFKAKSTHKMNIYDAYGNIMEIKLYASDGKLQEIYNFIYDENTNLIEIKGNNTKRQLINNIKYTYDEIGHVIEKEWIVDSNTYKKYGYSYDKNDNLIEIIYTNLNYNDLVDVIFQTAFEVALYSAFNLDLPDPYDPLDPAYGTVTDKPKNIYLRIERKYDDNRNLIEETIYNIEYQKYPDKWIEKYVCEYDNNGNIVKELRKRGNTSIELYHNYDDNGYKVETHLIYIQFEDLKTEIKSTIINDEEGKVIEIIENLKNSVKKNIINFSEKFEYDNYNNISKIYFFKNDKPKFLIERKIEYY